MELSKYYGINSECKVWSASPEHSGACSTWTENGLLKVSQLADNFRHYFSRVFETLLTNPDPEFSGGMRNTD